MCGLTGGATCSAIAAQRTVAWWTWAVAVQCQDYSDGFALWAILVARCWGGEPGHQWAWGQSISLRPISLALLSACYVAGLWDSASLPCTLFPVTRDVLDLSRAAESKASVSLLPLLGASLHLWTEHTCRRRQQGRDNEGNGGWWKLIEPEWRREGCIFISLPRTDPLTLVKSCDIAESQNSWCWKGPLKMVQIEVL